MGCELPFLPWSISLHISVFPLVRLSALKGQCTLQENTHNHLLRFYRPPPPPLPPSQFFPRLWPFLFFLVKGLKAKTLQHLMNHTGDHVLDVVCNQLTTPCKILTLLQSPAGQLYLPIMDKRADYKSCHLFWGSKFLCATLLASHISNCKWTTNLDPGSPLTLHQTSRGGEPGASWSNAGHGWAWPGLI